MCHKVVACRTELFGGITVNQAVYIAARMLDSKSNTEALGFKRHSEFFQHFKHVSRAVAGCQYDILSIKMNFRAVLFNNAADDPAVFCLYLLKP